MRRLTWVVAGLLLLGGCGGDPEPRFEAEPTPTVVESVTPSESVSPVAETPEEVIREWLDSETAMQNSGDTARYLAVAANCKPCMKLAQQVTRYYEAGGSIRFEGQRVDRIESFASNADESRFDVYINSGPTEFEPAAGAETQKLPGGPVHYRVSVRPVGSSWTVEDFFRIESS